MFCPAQIRFGSVRKIASRSRRFLFERMPLPRLRLAAGFSVVLLLFAPVLSGAGNPTTTASIPTAEQLAAALDAHGVAPEDYIVGKLRRYDVVLLGEDHRIRHNLELVHRLLPRLHQAGVYNFGMEFGASEDQAALDALVTAERYDENEARRLLRSYDVGWAFREYLDVYRAAWRLNRSLPPGARRFRILNLSYRYDWSRYEGIRTPVTLARVFGRGSTETFRAELLRREILNRPGEKIVVLTGTVHAFTRYRYPSSDVLADQFHRLEDRFMGNLLHRLAPERVCFIALHRAFDSQDAADSALVAPAHGLLDQAISLRPGRRYGFDLADTPMGALRDDSYYAIGHPDFRLRDFADGYIIEKPLAEFEGCSVDDAFLPVADWEQLRRQIPGEFDAGLRRLSREAYLAHIRDYANVPRVYHTLRN